MVYGLLMERDKTLFHVYVDCKIVFHACVKVIRYIQLRERGQVK